jgi:hypothetical protein
MTPSPTVFSQAATVLLEHNGTTNLSQPAKREKPSHLRVPSHLLSGGNQASHNRKFLWSSHISQNASIALGEQIWRVYDFLYIAQRHRCIGGAKYRARRAGTWGHA